MLLALAPIVAAQRPGLRDLPLPRDGRALLFSSSDPTGGNDDHGHPLATNPDGSQALARTTGPGVVTRIWSANPTGTLRITLDGSAVYDGPFAALLDGSTPGFRPPLAGRGTGGGALSLVPLAFASTCEILAVPEDPTALYHQIGLELGRRVTPGAVEREADVAALLDPGLARESCRIARTAVTAVAAQPTVIFAHDGACEIVELRLIADADVWDERSARHAWLEVHVDGEKRPSVAAPLGDLFGVAFDAAGIDTLPVHAIGNARVLRMPMPCRDAVTVTVAATAPASLRPFVVETAWRLLPPDHRRLPLRATFRRATTAAGEPFVVARVTDGPGHYVGAAFAFAGASGHGLTFLEGDETIRVDAETTPSIRGTGTEDDLNGAWYFRGGTFRAPWHAVAVLDETAGRVAAARFRGPDPVPFRTDLIVELEHGGTNDTPGADYAAVAFWYGAAPPEVVDAATRGAWARPQRLPHPVQSTVHDGRVRLDERNPAAALLLGATVGIAIDGRVVQVATMPPSGLAVDAADGTRADITPWLPALRHFRLAGPFAVVAPAAGIDTPFGPERDSEPDATFDEVAGVGPRGWFDAPLPGDWTGYVDLDALVEPNEHVVCYASCIVDSPVAQDATLVLGSDDAVRAWIDEHEVHRHVGVRGSGRDQDRVKIRLRAGPQRLLLKIEDYRGGFGFHARIESAVPVTSRTR